MEVWAYHRIYDHDHEELTMPYNPTGPALQRALARHAGPDPFHQVALLRLYRRDTEMIREGRDEDVLILKDVGLDLARAEGRDEMPDQTASADG